MPSGMISTPATGCSLRSFVSNASAGGQLEHPSDVKSSTTTGTRAGAACSVSASAANTRLAALRDFDIDLNPNLVADDRRGLDHLAVLQTPVAPIDRRGRRGAHAHCLALPERGRRPLDVERHVLRHPV